MSQLQKLELRLDDLLRKKAPFQLPENGRKSIAASLWWITLVVGVLQLWGAWMLWRAGDRVDRLVDYANTVSIYGPGMEPVHHLGLFFYVSLILLAIDGLILLAAFQGLQKFKKQGWDLLFYSVLLNAAAGVVLLFSDYGGGVGGFLRTLLFSVAGAYFLFQVREYFMGIKHAGAAVKVEKTTDKTAK